jgi:hypothetical protein
VINFENSKSFFLFYVKFFSRSMIRRYHPVVLVVVCVAILASVQFAIGRVWVFPTAPASAEENRNSRLVDDQ